MFAWWTEGSRETRVIEAVLRLGVAGCFIGHGAFGILTKAGWLPYFAVVGIPESWAWALMPIVGTVDIVAGLLALVVPVPAILLYMVGWGAWTALLRPLAGESFFEAVERAGNYGVPLAFLVATGFSVRSSNLRQWFAAIRLGRLTPELRTRVAWVLRASTAALLVGHGALALIDKPLLHQHLAATGAGPGLLPIVGWGEILLGIAILVKPLPALLLFAVAWKVGTEALYPLTGAPIWEFVERAGSYAAPLALLLLLPVPVAKLAVGRTPGRQPAGRTVGLLMVAAATVIGTGTLLALPAQRSTGDDAVLQRLRAGGLVLACRHAITDRSRGDSRNVDLDDPSTQRVLSDEGREQARRLGEVLSKLDVPIGEVFSSPYARTTNSGLLAFGKSERTAALEYGDSATQRRERRRLLREIPAGGNRVLMTHQGILYDNLPGVKRGSIREGDCVVAVPGNSDRPEILGRFGPEEFAALGQRVTRNGKPIRVSARGDRASQRLGRTLPMSRS